MALARLVSFIRYLSNWSDVWAAFRKDQPLPAFRFRSGLILKGGPRDDLAGLFREVFAFRCYTRAFYSPKPGDIVLDIGANIGVFVVFLRWLCPGVRVHAFEPIADTRESLIANVASNGLANSVFVHPVAVGGRIGELTLHHGDTRAHSSVVANVTIGNVQERVTCIDLATALHRAGEGPIHLLKIDTEGSEVEILGKIDPSVLDRVERVVVEYHGLLRAGSRETTMKTLRRAGFTRIEDLPDLPHGELGLIRASR